jgi:hypothetical protein
MPSIYSPVLIEQGGLAGVWAGQSFGAFAFNNALYTFSAEGAAGTSSVLQSLDAGATWNELDSANHVPSATATAFFDGDHTLIVAFAVAPATQLQPVRFMNFDLSTGLWGVAYGAAGAPSIGNVGGLQKRPDGSLLLFSTDRPFAHVGSGLQAHVFDGATWTANFDAGANYAALAGFNPLFDRADTVQACSLVDAAGRIHVAWGSLGFGHPGNFYQLIDTDNSLGTFVEFPAGDNLDVFSGEPLGNFAVYGTNLILSAVRHDLNTNQRIATIYVGTPLNAPVFTLLGGNGIESQSSIDNFLDPNNVPRLSLLGTRLVATWVGYDLNSNLFSDIHIAQIDNPSDPTTGWVEGVVWDRVTDSPPGFNVVGQQVQLAGCNLVAFSPAQILLSADGNNPSHIAQEQRYWFGVFVPKAGPAPFIPTVTTGGGPYVIPRPCKCDINDLAYEAIERFQERKREYPYRWTYPPPGAIRVTVQDTIAVPTVVAGQTQGLLYTVDEGFQFALERLVVLVSGENASPGDFTWSLDLNTPVGLTPFQGSPIQGFTNVDVPLGTLQIPWPLECPELFNPNDAIRVKLTNVNLAPGAPNTFKSMLLGWRWAVG